MFQIVYEIEMNTVRLEKDQFEKLMLKNVDKDVFAMNFKKCMRAWLW